ncbi:hypothetical protein [uncultured Litoreibacter sp.]|uniref:hypothetical protein n=1 Tax=uncultured Litoreibacter sp. TaxID=1392394 RepID=UPI002616124B|nr:hypothetical protein [uncultured Litoreibacter sp.]
MLKNRKKNLELPPETTDFWKLFDFFWDNGVGNPLNQDGEPVPWSEKALEVALEGKPTAKALGNWHSRVNLPSRESIQRLCRVILVDDEQLGRSWASSLLTARRLEEIRRKENSKLLARAKSKNVNREVAAFQTAENRLANGAALDSESVIEFESVNLSAPTRCKPSPSFKFLRLFKAVGLVLLSLAIYIFAVPFGESDPKIKISDIRFCSYNTFSAYKKSCLSSKTHFPAGTQKVYVSFQTDNIHYGEPFSRRWYRNGEKWLERNDFFDDTWQNYTWIHNQHGHDHGEYSMRIIVGDQVFSGKFTLGDL